MTDWRRIIGIGAVVALASAALAAAPPPPGSETSPTLVTGTLTGQSRSAQAVPALTDIARLADFQAMFDRDRGKTRIVLLMSPT